MRYGGSMSSDFKRLYPIGMDNEKEYRYVAAEDE